MLCIASTLLAASFLVKYFAWKSIKDIFQWNSIRSKFGAIFTWLVVSFKRFELSIKFPATTTRIVLENISRNFSEEISVGAVRDLTKFSRLLKIVDVSQRRKPEQSKTYLNSNESFSIREIEDRTNFSSLSGLIFGGIESSLQQYSLTTKAPFSFSAPRTATTTPKRKNDFHRLIELSTIYRSQIYWRQYFHRALFVEILLLELVCQSDRRNECEVVANWIHS